MPPTAEVSAALAALRTAVDAVAALLDTPAPVPVPLGLRVVEVTAGSVVIEWSGGQVLDWTVGRDGTDANGSPPWSKTLPPDATRWRFTSLRPSTGYTFTLTAADGRTASVKATTAGNLPVPASKTAAERYGWGTPHPISDEFGYEGPPDPAKWILPGDWAGHGGHGRRRPERTTVRDGMMVMTALPNGDAAWVRQRMPTRYGRWEQRSRTRTTSPGAPWHVLSLIWPTRENWPISGEYDWLETENPDQGFYRAYLHYPHPNLPVQQEIITVPGIDQREWHNYAFEWTPDHLACFIDGDEVARRSGGAGPAGRSAIQAMPEGALTLQIDHFGSNSGCVYELDYVRFYPLR